tara:strand:+ start:606 stop:833 length:228 start_codon:yes stop_codon:yes gene_type:complete
MSLFATYSGRFTTSDKVALWHTRSTTAVINSYDILKTQRVKANIIVCFDDTMKENREGKNLHCITEADTSNEKRM